MCGTVSSILSGLKTRSLGLNTLGTLVTVCPSRSSVHRFLGSTSTKQGKCDLLKATTKCAPAGVRTRDPLVRNPTPIPLRHSATLAVLMSTHNLCFRAKKNVYPCKPQFRYIKVGCKSVYIYHTDMFAGCSWERNARISPLFS